MVKKALECSNPFQLLGEEDEGEDNQNKEKEEETRIIMDKSNENN